MAEKYLNDASLSYFLEKLDTKYNNKYVDKTSAQTITGSKTFGNSTTSANVKVQNGALVLGGVAGSISSTTSKISFQNNSGTELHSIKANNTGIIFSAAGNNYGFYSTGFTPTASNSLDLGRDGNSANGRWNNIHMAGSIKKYNGTTGYTLTLPNKTGTVALTSDIPTVPTKDSDLTNDRYVRYDTASQGLTTTQKSNARTNIGAGTSNFSGSYNDLSNKPTIPTKTSDLTNDSNFITSSDLSGYATETWVTSQGYLTSVSWSDISNKPTIPSKTSDLTNDSGFITSSDLSGYATETWVGNQGFIKGINSSDVTTALGYVPYDSANPNGYITNSYHDATKQDVISDLSDIRSGASAGATAVQPSAISDMATKTWVGSQGYLKSVSWNDISSKPTFSAVATSGSYSDLSNKPTIPTDTSDLTNGAGFITSSDLSGYATQTWVENQSYATQTWVGDQGYLTSVSWSQVSDKPTFATVATSGSYSDLTNQPTIPTVSVSDTGTATDEVSYITINGTEKKLASGSSITFVDWS